MPSVIIRSIFTAYRMATVMMIGCDDPDCCRTDEVIA
jgi:hypothetical protein